MIGSKILNSKNVSKPQGSGRRAQGAGQRAQGAGLRAQGAGRRAQGKAVVAKTAREECG